MQGTEQGEVLPRNFLKPCILLLLGEQRAHVYELLARLRTLGFTQREKNGRYADGGNVYRVLHRLEADGLVCSARERSGRGGHRRTYDLTEGAATRSPRLPVRSRSRGRGRGTRSRDARRASGGHRAVRRRSALR